MKIAPLDIKSSHAKACLWSGNINPLSFYTEAPQEEIGAVFILPIL